MSRPWMPLYVGNYKKKTAHLSTAEHGAYLLLIMHYWACGSLPDDDSQLARIVGMSAGEWRKSKATLQAFFHDGWKHERIDEELAHASEISSKRRGAAEQMHNNRRANAEQKQTQSPSHSPPQKEDLKINGGGKKASGWSPPRHGAQSQKHGTVYVVKGTAEWPPYADEYFKAHGIEPVPDEGGGVWFKTCGYSTPVPDPKRLTRQ